MKSQVLIYKVTISVSLMYAHQSLFTTETFQSTGDPYSYLIENVLVGKCTKPFLPAVASRLRSQIQMNGSRIKCSPDDKKY